MPSRPGTLYSWDSNSTHIVVPTSGHQSNGYANNEVPGSGELNGLLQNVTQELQYIDPVVQSLLDTANAEITIGAQPPPGGNFPQSPQDVDLRVPAGNQLDLVSFARNGSQSGATQNATIQFQVLRLAYNATVPTTTQLFTGTQLCGNPDVVLTAPMNGKSTGLTVTVAVSGSATYTRSAGSWITDGFVVGQSVNFTGFTHAGNNIVDGVVTVVTATVLTMALTTQVVETSTTGAVTAVVDNLADANSQLIMRFTFALNAAATASATISRLQIKQHVVLTP